MSVERLKELMRELDCIQYGRFQLASGGVSDYKIVCDKLFENSEARDALGILGHQILRDIEGEKTYEIVGVVTGGYEFAKLVANAAGRQAIGVNPHNCMVEGRPEGENYCYFEDVVTTGGSILKARQHLEKKDGKDDFAICIADRDEDGRENLGKSGIKLRSILTKSGLGIKN